MRFGCKMVPLWDPKGTPKSPKSTPRCHPKLCLRKGLENVSKKDPFLSLWGCQNRGRVIKNQLFAVLEKVTKMTSKSLHFGGHLETQNLQNPLLGDTKKTTKKRHPKSEPRGPKRSPKQVALSRENGQNGGPDSGGHSWEPPREHFG